MRPPARLLLTGAALLVVASCSTDSAIAPSRSGAPVISGNPALRALATPTSVDFVIPAAGGEVSLLGMYTLSFPANAVCDPNAQDSQDGYASQSWDASCTAATTDIAVHATLKWSRNRLWVDFAPALRFVPSETVTLSTDVLAPLVRYYGPGAVAYGLTRGWGIGYNSAIEAAVSDDSRFDASVRTAINGSTGRISRRVKHFSGYSLTTGLACDYSLGDPDCVWFDVPPVWAK